MNEPRTPDEILSLHKILRSDPQRFLKTVDSWIENDPYNAQAYFDRHLGWMAVGEPRLALADMDKAIELDPKQADFRCRAGVHRHLGQYESAIEDYSRGEAMDPQKWQRDAFPLLYQADTYARLGDETHALACCARLPDDFWTPGMNDTPPGGKSEIADELRRRAKAARTRLSTEGGVSQR